MKTSINFLFFLITLATFFIACKKNPIVHPKLTSTNDKTLAYEMTINGPKLDTAEFINAPESSDIVKLVEMGGHLTITQIPSNGGAVEHTYYDNAKGVRNNQARSVWSKLYQGSGGMTSSSIPLEANIKFLMNHPSGAASGKLVIQPPWNIQNLSYAIVGTKLLNQSSLFERKGMVLELEAEVIRNGSFWPIEDQRAFIYLSNAEKFITPQVHPFECHFLVKMDK